LPFFLLRDIIGFIKLKGDINNIINDIKVISSDQIRAARSLVKWSANDLAQKSGVGVATIRRIELSDGLPSSNIKTLQAIKSAIEDAGIEFIGSPENGAGVRFKPKGG
jgi:transcriptional regulator with XRE-family HTH domain